jgi:hypothetical protein
LQRSVITDVHKFGERREPRVFGMAADEPISEISDISGFSLPAKWRIRLWPSAAV